MKVHDGDKTEVTRSVFIMMH